MWQASNRNPDPRENQNAIDKANEEFWNELCGSSLAKSLGIKDNSADSLALLDKWYLDFYDYLLELSGYEELRNKKALEVGLGYGTLGQKLAEIAADYTGMDIARGPVAMMNHRLLLNRLKGRAVQGNILKAPFEDESFDAVVSIGCFHHTGNIQGCINETYRLLRPHGKAFIMVYNQFSYRQWQSWPGKTFGAFLNDYCFQRFRKGVTEKQIASYDVNLEGKSAPETAFSSIHGLKKMFRKFETVKFRKTNCTDMRFFGKRLGRKEIMPIFGRFLGLDIYIAALKGGK